MMKLSTVFHKNGIITNQPKIMFKRVLSGTKNTDLIFNLYVLRPEKHTKAVMYFFQP